GAHEVHVEVQLRGALIAGAGALGAERDTAVLGGGDRGRAFEIGQHRLIGLPVDDDGGSGDQRHHEDHHHDQDAAAALLFGLLDLAEALGLLARLLPALCFGQSVGLCHRIPWCRPPGGGWPGGRVTGKGLHAPPGAIALRSVLSTAQRLRSGVRWPGPVATEGAGPPWAPQGCGTLRPHGVVPAATARARGRAGPPKCAPRRAPSGATPGATGAASWAAGVSTR